MLGAGPHPCTTLPRTCPPTPAPTAARSAPCVSLAVVGARRSCRPLQPADGPMPPLVRRFRPDLSPNSSASACRCLRRRPIAASRVGIVPSVLSGPPPDARSRCVSCFACLGLFPVQYCVHLCGLSMFQRVDCVPHSLRSHTPFIPRRATRFSRESAIARRGQLYAPRALCTKARARAAGCGRAVSHPWAAADAVGTPGRQLDDRKDASSALRVAPARDRR